MCNYSDMLAKIKRQPSLERLSRLYGLRNGELAKQVSRYTGLVKTPTTPTITTAACWPRR